MSPSTEQALEEIVQQIPNQNGDQVQEPTPHGNGDQVQEPAPALQVVTEVSVTDIQSPVTEEVKLAIKIAYTTITISTTACLALITGEILTEKIERSHKLAIKVSTLFFLVAFILGAVLILWSKRTRGGSRSLRCLEYITMGSLVTAMLSLVSVII